MTNELAIVSDNWMELAAAGRELPVPFAQSIFLGECRLDGTTEIDDILIKTQALVEGTALQLRREKAGVSSPHAIAVLTAAGDRIGWLPKKCGCIPARLMDGGKRLTAKLVSKTLEDHLLKLRVGIYFEDFR